MRQPSRKFLEIPAELRLMIYHAYFGGSEGVYEPRCTGDQWVLMDATANKAPEVLNLLATCRTIRAEAAPTFFAQNGFRFSDKPFHSTENGPAVSGHCRDCHRRRTAVCGLDLLENQFNTCPHLSPGETVIHLPECGLTVMDEWLELIGPKNVSRIRNVELLFTSDKFTKFDSATICSAFGALDSSVAASGGPTVERALSRLSQNANIHQFTISFDPTLVTPDPWSAPPSKSPGYVFRDLFSETSRLKKVLVTFGKMQMFRLTGCDYCFDQLLPLHINFHLEPAEDYPELESALEGYKEVKKSLEPETEEGVAEEASTG